MLINEHILSFFSKYHILFLALLGVVFHFALFVGQVEGGIVKEQTLNVFKAGRFSLAPYGKLAVIEVDVFEYSVFATNYQGVIKAI